MQPAIPPPPRRDIVLTLIGLQVICSLLGLGYTVVEYGFGYESAFVVLVTTLLLASLALYLRGYLWARYLSLLVLTLAFAGFLPVEAINDDFPLSIFIPPLYALLIADSLWILLSAVLITSILTLRAMSAGLILDPIDLVIVILVIGGMALARKITDDALCKQSQQTALLEAERVQLEARVAERTHDLQSANQSLLNANRLKDAFLANVSHELRSPLNILLGTVELLHDGVYGPTNTRQQEALGNAAASGRQLLERISDLLDLALIESGQLQLEHAPVLLLDLCESCLNVVRGPAAQRGMQVQFHYDPQLDFIYGDPRRLRQMLLALLDNALKFTPDGGWIGLNVTLRDARVELTVADSGIGIAPEQLAHLFEPFVQLDQRLSRNYEGVGMGLSLALHIARLHQGTITVESAPGQGSRFCVDLPYRQPTTPA